MPHICENSVQSLYPPESRNEYVTSKKKKKTFVKKMCIILHTFQPDTDTDTDNFIFSRNCTYNYMGIYKMNHRITYCINSDMVEFNRGS